MHRLIVEPEPPVRTDPPWSAGRHVRFNAVLEGTGEFVVQSRQPLVDGARVLLERGFDPGALLTMRHAGKGYDSFQPLPIGQWAGWYYVENDADGLRMRRWMPHPAGMGDQKSGSEAVAGDDPPAGGQNAPATLAASAGGIVEGAHHDG